MTSPGSRYGKRIKQTKITKVKVRNNKIVANFEEDGEDVQIELTDKQAKEFASEDESSSNEQEDDSESEEPMEQNFDQQTLDDDADSEVVILKRSQEEIKEQEEREMMKFVKFMKKKGLVMVQTATPGRLDKTTVDQ